MAKKKGTDFTFIGGLIGGIAGYALGAAAGPHLFPPSLEGDGHQRAVRRDRVETGVGIAALIVGTTVGGAIGGKI